VGLFSTHKLKPQMMKFIAISTTTTLVLINLQNILPTLTKHEWHVRVMIIVGLEGEGENVKRELDTKSPWTLHWWEEKVYLTMGFFFFDEKMTWMENTSCVQPHIY
jgi:hypothetical protein